MNTDIQHNKDGDTYTPASRVTGCTPVILGQGDQRLEYTPETCAGAEVAKRVGDLIDGMLFGIGLGSAGLLVLWLISLAHSIG